MGREKIVSFGRFLAPNMYSVKAAHEQEKVQKKLLFPPTEKLPKRNIFLPVRCLSEKSDFGACFL